MPFIFNQIIEDMMSATRRKALQSQQNGLNDAQTWARKADNALKTYPFEDISPDLVIKINPRAKRMALRVDPKKRVVNLVVPKRGSMRSAYEFALEHKYWIREKVSELPRPVHFTDGAIIPILGQNREIIIAYDKTLKTTDITLEDHSIEVSTNKEDPSARIKRFIIDLAKQELSELAHEKATVIDKKIKQIDVKDTTSRWGSCSHDGKLSFSWRLIFAPWNAFDYVVAHEVAHLCVMDHSPEFWDQCEELSEDYSRGKNWMRRNSGELIRYS